MNVRLAGAMCDRCGKHPATRLANLAGHMLCVWCQRLLGSEKADWWQPEDEEMAA